jgi:hypothetical protein
MDTMRAGIMWACWEIMAFVGLFLLLVVVGVGIAMLQTVFL